MVAKSLDLIIVVVVAIVAAALALAGVKYPAVQVLVGLPLVLILPGYALMSLLFTRRTYTIAEKTLLTIGLSIVITVISGFILNILPMGLQTTSWAIALGSVTLILSAAAFFRRQREGVVASSSSLISQPSSLSALTMSQVAMVGLAALIIFGAVEVSRSGINSEATAFTQLWMLPASETNQSMVKLGVSSGELTTTSYRVQLQAGNTVLKEWPSIELKPGEKWEATTDLSASVVNNIQIQSDKVEAVLYRLDAPQTVYRRVTLWSDK